jgi:hypothetical protein
VAARRTKLAQHATALQHRQQVLLGKAMQGFLLLHEEAQQERRELAAAAAPAMHVLQQLRQRWVLQAWQGAVKELQHKVALVSKSAVLCYLQTSVMTGAVPTLLLQQRMQDSGRVGAMALWVCCLAHSGWAGCVCRSTRYLMINLINALGMAGCSKGAAPGGGFGK